MHRRSTATPATWTLLLLLAGTLPGALHAASETKVRCGEILEGEFVTARESHDYLLVMQPGQVIKIKAIPTGEYLHMGAIVLDPVGNKISESNFAHHLSFSTGKLSARGQYRIMLRNHQNRHNDGKVGVFTISIGCILEDGSEVEPGAAGAVPAATGQSTGSVGQALDGLAQTSKLSKHAETVAEVEQYANLAERLVNVGKGLGLGKLFRRKHKSPAPAQQAPPPGPAAIPIDDTPPPGAAHFQQPPPAAPPAAPRPARRAVALEATPAPAAGFGPADLAGIIFPRMGLGMPLRGTVTPEGREIAGCRFVAEAGERIDLAFERLSGNLRLGLILVDPYDGLAFELQLVADRQLSRIVELPARGEYTLGIAALDPYPAAAAPTRFSVRMAASGAPAPGLRPPAVRQPAPLKAAAGPALAPTGAIRTAANARPGIVLFEHGDFLGRGESFVADDPDLSDNPIGRKTASSVRVPPGCLIHLYSKPSFRGRVSILDADVLNLRQSEVGNDAVSSLRVRCDSRFY